MCFCLCVHEFDKNVTDWCSVQFDVYVTLTDAATPDRYYNIFLSVYM